VNGSTTDETVGISTGGVTDAGGNASGAAAYDAPPVIDTGGTQATHGHSASGSLESANAQSTGSATVDVLNPFLAINYIIKAA